MTVDIGDGERKVTRVEVRKEILRAHRCVDSIEIVFTAVFSLLKDLV